LENENSDELSETYAKFHNPSKHLDVDEVIVLFKGTVTFKQYIQRKHKCFSIKTYKVCDTNGYTYDLNVYLGTKRQNVTQTMTATHMTVRSLTRREERVGHTLYMDNFFLFPEIFHDQYTRGINFCGTVEQN
jgi:hypothetical protein